MFKTTTSFELSAALNVAQSQYRPSTFGSSPQGIQPRSFEVILLGSGATFMQTIAAQMLAGNLEQKVVLTSYDVNNTLFQDLMSSYLGNNFVTAVHKDVYVPPITGNTKLGVIGLRTTVSSDKNLQFTTENTQTGSFKGRIRGIGGVTSPLLEYTDGTPLGSFGNVIGYYGTHEEYLSALQEYAIDSAAAFQNTPWPGIVMRLTSEGFIAEPHRQFVGGPGTRDEVDILGCTPEVVGYAFALDPSGSYMYMTGGQWDTTYYGTGYSSKLFNSYVEIEPPTSDQADIASPFNLVANVYGNDLQNSKPIISGAVFDEGRSYNYFTVGYAAKRDDMQDPTTPFTALTSPQDHVQWILPFMIGKNRMIYAFSHDGVIDVDAAVLDMTEGQYNEFSRAFAVSQGAANETLKLGVLMASNQGQGLADLVRWNTTNVQGEFTLSGLGVSDSIISIGASVNAILTSGFMCATGRTVRFGTVGWTS